MKKHFTLCHEIVLTFLDLQGFCVLFHPDVCFIEVISKTLLWFSLPSVEDEDGLQKYMASFNLQDIGRS